MNEQTLRKSCFEHRIYIITGFQARTQLKRGSLRSTDECSGKHISDKTNPRLPVIVRRSYKPQHKGRGGASQQWVHKLEICFGEEVFA